MKLNESEPKILFSAFLLIIISLLSSFCGGNKSPRISPESGKKYIFFPSLPAKPKYQYLTTFSTSEDIEKKKGKFFKFIAGKENEKKIPIRKAHGIDVLDGVIYVCDSTLGVIVTLDMKKNKFGYIGDKGRIKLKKAMNVKIDKENKLIYVSDVKRQQVISFNINGEVVKVYGKPGDFFPSDIDIKGDKLFIADMKDHQIKVVDINSGKIKYSIGQKGHGEGSLYHPSNICIHENKLYVSDTTNFRISIFDIRGNFIDKFGSAGKIPGTFARPKGIDVDRDGRIYVVDSSFQNLQIFNSKHQLLLFMLGSGENRYNITLPAVVTINYESLKYFTKYISPDFKAEYIIFITSNFGLNKVNVYAYGNYLEK